MKLNRCNKKIKAGEVPVGHMILEFGTRGIAQILDAVDLDFAIIDTEHSAFSRADVADLAAWFKATDVAPFVRIAEVQYHLIAPTLDAGILGIMVPNVKTGEAAKAIVNAAKYAPMGDRGVIMGQAHTDYKGVNPREFMDYANENITIICQIESQQGLDNLEAIASTPGVDILWVGHFDLTQSLGITGDFHHPKFLDGMKKVVEMADKYGLGAGIQPGSLEQTEEWMDMGFNVISYNGDFSVYQNAMRQAVDGVRALADR